MKLLLLGLVSFSAFAYEPMDCHQISMNVNLIDLIAAKECPSNNEVILKKVEAEYNHYYGKLPLTRKDVKGFRLKGSSKELDTLNEMLGKKPPKGWREAATGCDTAQCALSKLMKSKEAAMQLMNIKAKSGYALLLDQSINQGLADQTWSAAEVREIDAAISKLPKEMRYLKLQKIQRIADGLRQGDHSESTGAFASPYIKGYKEAQLVTYDTGMRNLTKGKNPYEGTSWPQEVIVHELCHHHDFKGYYATNYGSMTSEQRNSAFAKLSGWKEKTNSKGESSWSASKSAQFVSWYAETAPAEDYAESCMNYILHPETLKTKAPSKYAYMKKNVFNNKEFLNEPWASDKSKHWPELNRLLSDGAGCNVKLAECTKNMKLSSLTSVESQIQRNECFVEFKKKRLQEINIELGDDPKYCEKGGQTTVTAQLDKICGNSTKALAKLLDDGLKTDLKLPAAICETKNDFTAECVIKEAKLELNVPAELAPNVNRLLASRVPDRMAALGNKMDLMKSSAWIKGCLNDVKELTMYEIIEQGTGIKKPILYYSSSNTNIESGPIARYTYQDYDRNDINKSCAEGAMASLEGQGVKPPTSGFPVNVMQRPFKEEFESFETEVLMKMRSAMQGCFLSGCKDKRVLELMKNWEEKSPDKRSGMATEEYARELREKLASYF